MKIISPVNTEERKKLGLKAGDTVKVWQKLREGDKTRLQAFEGLVLSVKHGKGAGAAFTVRKVSGGVGLEKIFPLHSPMIDKIEIIKRAKVRRSKLYHIREKAAKEIRRQMRNMSLVSISTGSATREKVEKEKTEAEKKVDEKTDEGIDIKEVAKESNNSNDAGDANEDTNKINKGKGEEKIS